MKLRELGKSILDFELNNIATFVTIALSLLIIFSLKLIKLTISLYKSLWPLLLLVLAIILLLNIEYCNPESYCYGVNLGNNYWLDDSDETIGTITFIPLSIFLAFIIDKKFSKLAIKTENKNIKSAQQEDYNARSLEINMDIRPKEHSKIIANGLGNSTKLPEHRKTPASDFHEAPRDLRVSSAVNDLNQVQKINESPLAKKIYEAIYSSYEKLKKDDLGPFTYDLPYEECWEFALDNRGYEIYRSDSNENRVISFNTYYQDGNGQRIISTQLSNYSITGEIDNKGNIKTQLLDQSQVSIRVSIVK